jgi:hypothetical protein
LLIQAFFLLPLAALALGLLGARRWQSALAGRACIDETPAGSQVEIAVHQAQLTTRMVRAAGWHGPYRANCLQQSIILCWFLRRQGIKSHLRIGVRKEGSRLEAHAWVEFLGVPLNESDDVRQRFAPFDRAILAVRVKSH